MHAERSQMVPDHPKRSPRVRALTPDDLKSGVFVSSTVVATLLTSTEGKVLGANPRMLEFLGATSVLELTGESVTSLLVAAEDWDHWERAWSTSQPVSNIQLTLRGKGGEDLHLLGDISPVLDARGNVLSLVGTFSDITEIHQLRRALQRTARMEALGGLTSGIAHDFNNLLTILVGNLFLLAEAVRHEAKLFEKAKRARDAAKRGADLTRQLLAFAREHAVEASTLDPGKAVSNLEALLRHALGTRVTLETNTDLSVWPVAVNLAQLESALVNLTINARDAMEGAGAVRIELSNRTLTDSETDLALFPGDYVCLSVVDDGPGIPAAHVDRVFEPFFSTKDEREGTGLGLSMVRWFIEQAGGAVSLESQPGEGTTVTLWLPRAVTDTPVQALDKTMPLSTLPSGDEAVLVLAQEENLRSTLQQTLEVLGYRVRLAADPKEALGCLDRRVGTDLLVIDADLRGANLMELASEAQRLSATVRTLIIGDDPARIEHAGVAILAKPFSLPELACAVRRALDTNSHA